MTSLATRYVDPEPTLAEGRIVGRDDAGYEVRCGEALWRARRAASCLLEPALDDSVLLSFNPGGRAYVLAVLERPVEAAAVINFPGDVELRADKGQLRMAARDGMDFAATGEISLLSASYSLNTLRANLQFSELTASGGICTAQVEKLKLLARAVDSVVERIMLRATNSYRVVAETEHARCGALHYLVDKVLSLRSKHSVMTARGEMKIDGERIHMG